MVASTGAALHNARDIGNYFLVLPYHRKGGKYGETYRIRLD